MALAVQTLGLTKDYGSGRGLFDLDLEVEAGEVFGYLGPNGAGKTTTIRLLMGLIHADRGTATVFGLDCDRQSVPVKKKVSYLPGDLPSFAGLRGSEVVAHIGALRGEVDAARVRDLCERLDLDLGRRYREYSHGNKQKLGLVLAFMAAAPLMILDEPTSGLDPLNQQEFYRLIREAREAGTTIFLSSHILSEVEHVCDRVGIIREGRLVKVAGLEEVHQIRMYYVEIEFAEEPPAARLRAAGVERLETENGTVRGVVHGSFEPLMAALDGARVVRFVSREPTLEETFLAYYERASDARTPAP